MAESPFPLPSLGLLVPPLRMMSAVMWQVVRQGNTKHYGKLEEFVSMVTEVVPELLSNRQRWLLILALRGRVTLELFRSGHPDDLEAVQTHLDRITASGLKQSNDAAIEFAESNFLKLIQSLVEDPDRREHFFKVVFPVEYGPNFDSSLQTLVCHFLSRLEELLPVPDFKQTALLISAAPSVLEDYMRCVSHGEDLKSLLQNQHCPGKLPKSVPSRTEDRLLVSLSFPPSLRLANASRHSARDSPPLEIMTDSLTGQWVESKASTDDRMTGTESVESQGSEGKDQLKERPKLRLKSEEGREAVVSEHQYSLSSATAEHDSAQSTTTTTTTAASSSSSSVSSEQPRQRVAHKCPQCGRCFIYLYEMLEHQRLHTGENPYKCSQCGKTFRRSSEMSTHRRTQCSNAAYVCIKCGSSFESIRERIRHRCSGGRRASGSGQAGQFECPQCGKIFKWHNSLKKHLVTHTTDKVFNCRYCGEGPFPGVAELRAHQKAHGAEDKPYKCKQCGKGFSSQVWQNNHEQRHSQERSKICSSCGKAFRCKGDLKLHMRTHTGERPYQCTYCAKRFSVNGNLTIHIRTHTGEKPFLCSDCGKAFCSAGELQIHRRTHTGERPYKCTVCEKGFTMASKVTLHMRVHTGVRPYICHECGKAFSRGAELKKHVLNHTGVRPYPCHLCSKTYTCLNHLKRHLKTHSGSQSLDMSSGSTVV
ncbi:zinc finger protein ZFMSA12A isoform X1 [Salmo salar]|uniref:Zinc finger protein ZFMSA12A isoform X1 n=1 Tax=Salmo salar TaxID=8030 RepID=A0A1S3QSH0_SALSA|nr:zinc finger protein ZFMSA12A-like isoform X1 [Salmo salar]|eukprot:XP_014043023.1 PREDICTED: zinc finger protein ZFMSA12A-like isoform X1 [Salmo salar]